ILPRASSRMYLDVSTPSAVPPSIPIRRITSISASCVPSPAPRPARSSALRSNTSTRQPLWLSRCAANIPPSEPPMISACPPMSRPSGIGAQFVEDEILDEDRLLANKMRGEMRAVDQLAAPAQIRIRGQQQIDDAARREALARLIEQRRDVPIAGARMPGAVRQIARLAGERRRAGDDDIEQRARREARHQVRGDALDLRQTVVAAVLRGCTGRVWIDVERNHTLGAGARRGEGQEGGAGADLCHAFAGEIELADEAREILAGQEHARMEHGRRNGQAKAGNVGHGSSAMLQE